MKKLLNVYILFWVLCPFLTTAQTWASYSTQLPTKDYWGHKFKLSASIKTDIVDDSASARIWARAVYYLPINNFKQPFIIYL